MDAEQKCPRGWTEEWFSQLQAIYPLHGAKGCMKVIPKTKAAITQTAKRYKIRRLFDGKPRGRRPNAEKDVAYRLPPPPPDPLNLALIDFGRITRRGIVIPLGPIIEVRYDEAA